MPNPIPGDLHVDRLLTEMSVSWVQDTGNFVANRVFPIVPVAKQSDIYAVYDKGFFYRDEMQERPLGGASKEAGYGISQGTYRCTEDSLAHKVDDRVRANADQPFDPDKAAMRFLTSQAMIHLDRQWANDYFKTGVWGQTDQTGVAAAPAANQFLQFDQAGSKPIQTIRARASAIGGSTGFAGNKLVMGNDVFDVLCDHPDVIDRIKYTQTAISTEQILASLFHVDEVIVAKAIQNTAKEGQANAMSRIVSPKAMLLVHAADAPSVDTPSAGYTFAWTGLIPGATNAMGGVIQRMRDEMAHSDYFEIRQAVDTAAVATELGQFFAAAVA